jgi:hypothetical protein
VNAFSSKVSIVLLYKCFLCVERKTEGMKMNEHEKGICHVIAMHKIHIYIHTVYIIDKCCWLAGDNFLKQLLDCRQCKNISVSLQNTIYSLTLTYLFLLVLLLTK